MLERTKLIDNIISEIKNKITSGELKNGEMLASQDELAKTMGVSRASLREALNSLELMGLIESKQGRGTFVRTIEHTDFMNGLSTFLIMDQESAMDLLEARRCIEGAVASLAANNAGKNDLRKMEQVLKQMEKYCNSEDLESFIAADVQFHLLVAESSNNRVLAKIVGIIRDLLLQLVRKVFEHVAPNVSNVMSLTIKLHRDIYDAIRRRDATSARKHMEAHIMDVRKKIQESQNWL